jgi:hypothetical protein
VLLVLSLWANPPVTVGLIDRAKGLIRIPTSPSKPATLPKTNSACAPIKIMLEEGATSEGALD